MARYTLTAVQEGQEVPLAGPRTTDEDEDMANPPEKEHAEQEEQVEQEQEEGGVVGEDEGGLDPQVGTSMNSDSQGRPLYLLFVLLAQGTHIGLFHAVHRQSPRI
jgi:hypothetical protein